ncbi:MAG: epoxyqueuosine reductase QueH [Rickettsiales bacterium]|jgi:predicted adenine nucleotide alpha hydrolase (AANH) superfamily ATPase|nr:epoxyqueuosine reductase QueH [Rickettsiales bacterium]
MTDSKPEIIKLVLVSCCAPCSCGAIRQLADGGIPGVWDFIVLFYNPNIYPDDEYRKRLAEQIRYCETLGVKYAVGLYDHNTWLSEIRGLESRPERGARCSACFKHRFRFAQKFASENGYNAIASVLGVSRYKNQAQVDACAAEVLTEVKYMLVTWNDSLKREISKNTSFYRQNYCGCEFSMRQVH